MSLWTPSNPWRLRESCQITLPPPKRGFIFTDFWMRLFYTSPQRGFGSISHILCKLLLFCTGKYLHMCQIFTHMSNSYTCVTFLHKTLHVSPIIITHPIFGQFWAKLECAFIAPLRRSGEVWLSKGHHGSVLYNRLAADFKILNLAVWCTVIARQWQVWWLRTKIVAKLMSYVLQLLACKNSENLRIV